MEFEACIVNEESKTRFIINVTMSRYFFLSIINFC